MRRDEIIAIAVAMGTDPATAAANYDAAYPPPEPPGAADLVGAGREVLPDGSVWTLRHYGDGRIEREVIV